MTNLSAVFFDLDGTLLDSAPDLIAALNWLRSSEGLPPLNSENMNRHVSHGAAGILEAGMPATTTNKFEEWKALFLEQYASVGYRESRLYPGIPAVLDALEDLNIPWGIITNKIKSLTLPILQSAGLAERAACVVCGDTLSRNKPDPAPVLFACDQLGVSPVDTVFAGDDIRDLQAGKSAGTRTAAVMYGYGSHEFSTQHLVGSVIIKRPDDFYRLLE